MNVDVRTNELKSLQQQMLDSIILASGYEWILTNETIKAIGEFHSMGQLMTENCIELDARNLEIFTLVQAHIVTHFRQQLHTNVIHNLSFDEEHTRKRLLRHRR